MKDEGSGRRRGSGAGEPTGDGVREQVVGGEGGEGGGGICLQVAGRGSSDWEWQFTGSSVVHGLFGSGSSWLV